MKQKKPEKVDVTSEGLPLQATAFSSLEGLAVAKLPPGRTVTENKTEPQPRGQNLLLRREKKDRGGKTVVVISGFDSHPAAIEELARHLRKQLGCGGTVEKKEIVIQGDQPSAVAALLQRLGHRVRGVVV